MKLSPRRFNFGRLSRKAPPQTKTITVTRGDSDHFKPKLEAPSTPGLDATMREVEPGEKYEVVVTIDPSKAQERFATNLQLETGVPESPKASLSVYAQVIPRVMPTPSRFTVQPGLDREQSLSVQLRWDDNNPGKILSETVNDSNLAVKVEERNNLQFVRLTVPPNYQPSPGSYAVTLISDDPDAKTIRVPISMRYMRNRRTAGTPAPKPVGPRRAAKEAASTKEAEGSKH